jgi:hypothetical protein
MSDLVLLPWSAARRLLGEQPLAFRLLGPPYPAVGGGTLRVLRVRPRDGAPLEVLCGYERYRRL